MPGLFQGLEIGKRALVTHQLVLQTLGHNIANVNTPGYTRQRVRIDATDPETGRLQNVGSGVEASDIRHVRDLFLGEQFRADNKLLGQWTYKERVLGQIESLFGEPGDNTLMNLMNNFWDAWSDLSTNPSSISHRVAVTEQANLMTDGFHQLSGQLDKLRSSVDADLANMISDVNRLAEELSRLNAQITRQELGGVSANDLRDARDLILDELSTLVDVNSFTDDNGQFVVQIGAMEIVNGDSVNRIDTRVVNRGGVVENELFWRGSTVGLTNLRGQLRGLLEVRDTIIPAYADRLDTLARTLIDEVNAIHQGGFGLSGSTGVAFFDTAFTDAKTVRVNNDILLHPERIAVSASGEPGDNTLALALHELRSKKTMTNGTTSMGDFYNGVVGEMGIESHQAQSYKQNYELLVAQVENARQSVQGVSLDEEMTALVKYQHAYEAAARVITTMDEALSIVIGQMGIVGR